MKNRTIFAAIITLTILALSQTSLAKNPNVGAANSTVQNQQPLINNYRDKQLEILNSRAELNRREADLSQAEANLKAARLAQSNIFSKALKMKAAEYSMALLPHSRKVGIAESENIKKKNLVKTQSSLIEHLEDQERSLYYQIVFHREYVEASLVMAQKDQDALLVEATEAHKKEEFDLAFKLLAQAASISKQMDEFKSSSPAEMQNLTIREVIAHNNKAQKIVSELIASGKTKTDQIAVLTDWNAGLKLQIAVIEKSINELTQVVAPIAQTVGIQITAEDMENGKGLAKIQEAVLALDAKRSAIAAELKAAYDNYAILLTQNGTLKTENLTLSNTITVLQGQLEVQTKRANAYKNRGVWDTLRGNEPVELKNLK
jgi:hypothetical protein